MNLKGIKARIYETFTVLLLLLILASTLVWVLSAFMAKNDFTWFAKVPGMPASLLKYNLHKKCPNMEFFLVRIFPYLD